MRTNRTELAKLAVDILLPRVERCGATPSIGHPSMESSELQINGLVVLRSQSIENDWSKRERILLLDIWPMGGNKVLSVSLPPLRVVSLKPGEWMDVVAALADRTGPAHGAYSRGGSDLDRRRHHLAC